MEITDRDDLGRDLRAPQTNAAGADEWSYTLVAHTQPGDIVFHWHKTAAGEPAIVGWSEVVGPLYADSMDWLAHGSRGRARGSAEHVDNWVMPLGGLHEFKAPVTRSMLDSRRDEVFAAIGRLGVELGGATTYAPFYLYGKVSGRATQLRAMQSYLTKFPATLVPTIAALTSARALEPSSAEHQPSAAYATPLRSANQGRLQDPVLRRAIEAYAVARAKAHYRAAGATRIDELGKPYDLKVELDGVERHVEVKGTTVASAVSVVLTIGELRHVREYGATDLFVVDGIAYEPRGDGYDLAGGESRILRDWQPDGPALHPTEFSYVLGDGWEGGHR